MLGSSLERIESLLAADDLVLDVGGWASPLPRADWVIDLRPHGTRGLYGGDRPTERFSAETWVVRDICGREPWPFVDDQFDFAVCSHTLEDVRDPIWVCAELSRVAAAGYVEVPSRLAEQSYGVVGPMVGWSHHRWLVEVIEGGLEFMLKPHAIHARPELHFAGREGEMLIDDERFEAVFWEGELPARELICDDAEDQDAELAAFVARHRERLQARIPPPPPLWRRLAWQLRHRKLSPPHGSTWR